MENPIQMDDLGGFPPIFGNTWKHPYGPYGYNLAALYFWIALK